MKLFIKGSEDGVLLLVDSDGERVGDQKKVIITEEIGKFTEVTVTFIFDEKDFMYKGE